jgi:imidazolonepropionase
VVIPGSSIPTHPAFPRLLDFEKRSAGASYEEISQAGGGIRSSVEAVRSAGKSRLTESILASLNQMLAIGTTTVETKSG